MRIHAFSLLLLLGGMFLVPRAAIACGATPTPYMTLAGSWPQDGAIDVPLGAPLLLNGTAWPSSSDALGGSTLAQIAQVEVRAKGSQALLPGKLSSFFSRAVWVPSSALAPSTSYEVKIHLNNDMEPPDNLSGSTDLQLSFTTGTTPLAPLRLAGEPSYVFTTRELPYCPSGQFNDCGDCDAPQTHSAPVVEITPPAVEGGAPGGVLVRAWLWNGTGIPAGTVNLVEALGTEDSSKSILIQIPSEDAPYERCLRVEVSDALGSKVTTESKCFADPSAGAAGAADASPAQDGSNDGCNTGRGHGGGWWLVALAWALRRREKARENLTPPAPSP